MNKRRFFLALLFIISIAFLAFAKADVISINSGGNINLAITPDKYIEGFFSQINSPIIPVTTPNETGGGTSGGTTTGTANIVISPTEMNIDMVVNGSLKRTITITNFGNAAANVSLSQSKLSGIAFLGNGSITSMTIGPGETKTLQVTFVAPGTAGNYAGTINIGDKKVLVSINVKTVSLLFDSHIVVLNPGYSVSQGNSLKTQVTLIPMGENVRTDVTLNYEIKDYNGTVWQKKSETILVTSLTNLYRNFNTNLLPPGKYIISLEIVYSNGVAPSSAQFEVTPKTPVQRLIGILVFILIIAIIIVGILIIIVLMIRILRRRERVKEYLKKRRKNNFA